MTRNTEPGKRNKGGRPTKYTPALGDRICAWIAEGNSARSACEQFGISRDTLFRWLREHGEFSDQYARAREDQADTIADEVIEIADTEDDPQKARVRVDARKWAAARMSPRKWGDRQQVEHSGQLGITHEQALDELK